MEDKHYYPFPQTLSTERPDRVAGSLVEGRISLMVNGNPYALILPVSILDTIYSNDDDITRAPYKIFIKLVRVLSLLITVFLPCVFISAINFHNDLIPTNLLLTMSSLKEKVPFPFSIEIIFMILVYEIAQESRLRIPSQLGSVVGLVGSLILGQSAVTANIISPITIIITSVSILTSLTIPDYYISSGFRMIRLFFMVGAMLFGFLGISLVLYSFLLYTFHLKPFKVPLIQPFYIDKNNNVIKRFFGVPLKNLNLKPYFIPQPKQNKKKARTKQPT
ncbi:MAG: spore germination protein [Clostridia bacterium]|nr:spore germination protein [Clostridia bacterium]